MTKQSEEDLAEEEDKQSPLFYPPAPPDELFDVATTVDPGYVISLIRKILPPNVVECYYSNDENIYEDLVQPSKSDDMELTVLSPTTNNGLGKYESKNNSGDLFEKSEILSREQAWEESGCILWDLAASETHAEFMVENLILEVLLGNLNFNHHVRAKEITLGIVGNLACHKGSMNHIVSSKGLIEIIVDQLFVDDTPCLCEACRVLTLGVRGDQSVKWVDVLQNQDVLIRLLWVAENTLHPQLIEKSVRLLLGLVECNLPSASSIHATLMNLGLSQLLINLLSFEIRTFMNERLSERFFVEESMESLFSSMEVRDLLPGDNAGGESSPLSVPDLRILINSLQARSDFLRSQALRFLLSHRIHFLHLFSISSQTLSLSSHSSSLLDDLFSILSSRSSALHDTHGSLSDLRFVVVQLSQKRRLLHLVRIVACLNRVLGVVEVDFRSGFVVEAVEKMIDLKKDVRVTEVEESEPVVYRLLRKAWFNRFEEIQSLLVRCMGEAVRFDVKRGGIIVRYELLVDVIGRIELRIVLDAIRVAGIIQFGFADMVDVIIQHVVNPVVRFGSSVSVVDKSALDGALLNDEAALYVIPTLDDPFHHDVGGELVYSSLICVVRFVCDFICFQNSECVRIFGDLAWQRMKALIISEFFSKVTPDDDLKLAGFQRIVKQTYEFESVLRDIMFIPGFESKEDQLSSFAQGIEKRFASRKKNEVLAKARNLIMDCDFEIPSRDDSKRNRCGTSVNGDGEEEDLISGSLVISQAASRLLELVHQVLQESCSSSEAVGYQLYHAARDALILYEAIVPVMLEKHLHAVSHVAVLVHNDCIFLYREVLGLGSQYQAFPPSQLKENAFFTDIAARFLVLGDEILFSQIKLIVFNLNEVVDTADGFQNTQLMPEYESAKFSIDQVCFLLEKVHIFWEPLLLFSTYRRNMCSLLESVFSRVVIEILILDDIGAEETLQLQKLIVLMLENTYSLVESLIHPNRGVVALPLSLSENIPSLLKVRKLSELLDMPMKSITEEWENMELVKCGFNAEEVENFIKSTFTDTSFRKECIGRIRSTKRIQ